MIKLFVQQEQVGTRLDVFCQQFSEHSRSKVGQMIKEGKILVNQQQVKSSYKVELEDEITMYPYVAQEMKIEPIKMDLDIIYEDDDLLVVNKPKGLVVHPGAGVQEKTLVAGLLAYTNTLANADDPIRPGIVHRLDKDTSGLLVVAKNDVAHAFLSEQLKDHTMHRIYTVLVHGVFPHARAKVDAPIGRDSKNRLKMAITEFNSKPAFSHFTKIEAFDDKTLMYCQLETGRTHQIRVHAEFMGYPVVNDPLYGNRELVDNSGQFLHASKLILIHPTTKETMTFECDLEPGFAQYVESLRK